MEEAVAKALKRARAREEAGAGESTRERVLAVTARLIMERGFNGFSTKDVAAEVGVSHVAVHHYYRTKEDLGEAAVRAYTEVVRGKLARFEAGAGDACGRLRAFVESFVVLLREGKRVCICAPLGSEYDTLPGRVRRALQECVREMEEWLERVIEEGVRSGELALSGPAREAAEVFLATVDGAMVNAKAMEEEGRLERAGRAAIERLRARA